MGTEQRATKMERWVAENGGEQAFFDFAAEGKSLKWIAKKIGVSLPTVHTWLNADRERRRAALRDAWRDSADVIAERSREPLEDLVLLGPNVSAPEVQLATQLSNHDKWLAGVRNRAEYGDQRGQVNVNLSFGDLMREALVEHGHAVEVRVNAPPPELPEAEYELLSSGDEEE